jgi:hypothetical protein
MTENVKKTVIGSVAGVAVLVAGFAAYQSFKPTSTQGGVTDSAKEIMSHSNTTEVLSPEKQKDVIAHGVGPGSKRVPKP